MKALVLKATKSLIKAVFRAYRKGKIRTDGDIERAEIAAVGRELLDLVIDELDNLNPSRHGAASELLSDMRYRAGQLQERMARR